MTDLKEQIAINLWHRFAPEGHMEWSEERHAAEYRDAADAVLFLAHSSKKSEADSLQAASLKKLAAACRVKADLYAKAHPEIPASFRIIAHEIDLIAAGSSSLTSKDAR